MRTIVATSVGACWMYAWHYGHQWIVGAVLVILCAACLPSNFFDGDQ